MGLEDEVSKGRKVIHTDAYPISIGEIINIYRDGDLDIHPEFQREFRWKPHQKSKLIESILLGIPLPSIFVAQRDDGVWDVVDGVQRLSTIMSFVGELKNEEGIKISPLPLQKTQYLPSLENISWVETAGTVALSDELKRAFKREKIDVKIIKSESDENAKFELFQRLNTGGTDLSEQEVRNCLLLMLNRDAYEWLKKVSENSNFRDCLSLTERQLEEKNEMELALRFLISIEFDPSEKIDHSDIGPFITSQMKMQLVDRSIDFEAMSEFFGRTFKILNETLGEDSFKRYSTSKQKHEGAFSVALFELISSGVAFFLRSNGTDEAAKSKLLAIVQALPDDDRYSEATKHGVRAVSRFPRLIELARELFS